MLSLALKHKYITHCKELSLAGSPLPSCKRNAQIYNAFAASGSTSVTIRLWLGAVPLAIFLVFPAEQK